LQTLDAAQSPDIRVNKALPDGLRRDVHHFVVNRGAPELFPVMSLVKKWFTPREMEERRAFVRAGCPGRKLLKVNVFL
jgi:hypothetical protein